MKTISELGKALLIALVVLLLPIAVHADDTELFYAKVKADSEDNRAVANLMILVDTSGSMKWCEQNLGDGSQWCKDASKRRINMLQDAMLKMLDTVPEGVRLGLGRFRDNNCIEWGTDRWGRTSCTRSRDGGRVLIPVVELTPGVRAAFEREIEALNAAGDSESAGGSASPSGGTPTDRAYSEMARYMMGMAPKYGATETAQAEGVCFQWAERETKDCSMVPDGWNDWVEIPSPGSCTVNPDGDCKVEYGDPVALPAGETCNPDQPDCQIELSEWSAWNATACDLNLEGFCERRMGSAPTGPDISGSCDADAGGCSWNEWSDWSANDERSRDCDNISRDWYQQQWYEPRRGRSYCRERSRTHQVIPYEYRTRAVGTYYQLPATYFSRDQKYSEVCGKETYCAQYGEIRSADGNYASPMNLANQCESNHVLIFTDGAPNGTVYDQDFADCDGDSYACQRDIAAYLADENINAKKRKVKTYNIGLYMGNNQSSMESVSTDGAEGTFNADNAEALAKAFAGMVDLVKKNARSFSAPGVAVNQMNRLEHLDQLYYAVFEPKKSSYWEGNLKRYRVLNDKIVDVREFAAIDPATGFFASTAKSFWSSKEDGADVSLGGAREQIGTRLLFYSDAFGDTKQLNWDTDNTPAFYGLPATATTDEVTELKEVLKTTWGDPLHSEPVLVNYGGSSDNNRIFVSGNDGMLRAINSQTGAEVWSFMPYEMIRKANLFTVDRPGLALNNDRQAYGLDGSWTAWRRPGATASSAPSKVYLYGGMRRGGTSYYAVDATGTSPELMWQIDRGDTGFERLGQTWSQPTLTQVKVGGSKRPALVFGGGYDPDGHDEQQDAGRSGEDDMGNIIYVVDALTGKLLWSAGGDDASTTVASMKWSVPANISVVDANFDGVADFFYFGDLGGQLFRVDLDDAEVGSSKVRRIADLSGTGATNNRRFYYAPSISYIKSEDGTQESFYISIGSGYRTHPLSEQTDDYFFVIRDDGVARDASRKFVGSAPASVLTTGSLDTLSSSAAADPDKPGWKLPLAGDGEKALSAAVVFNNRIFFTTYMPGADETAIDDDCMVKIGTTFLYVVDLVTGQGASLNNDGTLGGDRRKELEQDVPPPSPTLLSDGEKVLVIIGTEVAGGASLGNTGLRRGSWYQLQPGDADKVPGPVAPPKQ